jgi:aspartyl-tRNA(Asn)/glutamyl-tRNA(Gln) amidotransferase subunit A
MLRRDVDDPAQAPRDIENTAGQIELGVANLRIARASGFFEDAADAAGRKAVDLVAASLGSTARADYPEPLRARAAAFLITMAEGAALHLDNVRARAADYDPDVRERLMAGALLPAAWVQKAQKFRRWHAAATAQMFQDVDILIAPSTPCQAPMLGQKMFTLAGTEVPVRANLGVFTQPFSFIGLPIVSVPVWLDGEKLPIGVQLIAAPWREDIVLRAARALEAAGVATAPIAKLGVA